MNYNKEHKEFIDAVKFGNPRILNNVLENLSSISRDYFVKFNESEMFLWTLKYGKIEIAEILKNYGATILPESRDNLILYICKNRDVKILEYIINISSGSIVMKKNELSASIEYANNQVTEYILKNYHSEQKYELSKLTELAIQVGNLEGLKILLNYGAKINKGNKSLLIHIIERKDEGMLDFIISYGMKVTLENSGILKTILSQPEGYPKELWVQHLIRRGADPAAIKNELKNKKYSSLQKWCQDYEQFKILSTNLNNDLIENTTVAKPKL